MKAKGSQIHFKEVLLSSHRGLSNKESQVELKDDPLPAEATNQS